MREGMRKEERECLQYKARQRLSGDSLEKAKQIEKSDPERFARNTSVTKMRVDPATRNESLNNKLMWNKLNCGSRKSIDMVINKNVLGRDKYGCENVLSKILADKKVIE